MIGGCVAALSLLPTALGASFALVGMELER
jgi:hypothetical protein